uniref:polynucleotide adenylyltransferase n=1 Tax=Globodera rostochiensis TaxID=31243 RepID=A0A914I0S3_GLORO
MEQHTYTEQPQRQNFQYYPNPPPPVVYERRYAERDSGPRCVPCCCCFPCIPIPLCFDCNFPPTNILYGIDRRNLDNEYCRLLFDAPLDHCAQMDIGTRLGALLVYESIETDLAIIDFRLGQIFERNKFLAAYNLNKSTIRTKFDELNTKIWNKKVGEKRFGMDNVCRLWSFGLEVTKLNDFLNRNQTLAEKEMNKLATLLKLNENSECKQLEKIENVFETKYGELPLWVGESEFSHTLRMLNGRGEIDQIVRMKQKMNRYLMEYKYIGMLELHNPLTMAFDIICDSILKTAFRGIIMFDGIMSDEMALQNKKWIEISLLCGKIIDYFMQQIQNAKAEGANNEAKIAKIGNHWKLFARLLGLFKNNSEFNDQKLLLNKLDTLFDYLRGQFGEHKLSFKYKRMVERLELCFLELYEQNSEFRECLRNNLSSMAVLKELFEIAEANEQIISEQLWAVLVKNLSGEKEIIVPLKEKVDDQMPIPTLLECPDKNIPLEKLEQVDDEEAKKDDEAFSLMFLYKEAIINAGDNIDFHLHLIELHELILLPEEDEFRWSESDCADEIVQNKLISAFLKDRMAPTQFHLAAWDAVFRRFGQIRHFFCYGTDQIEVAIVKENFRYTFGELLLDRLELVHPKIMRFESPAYSHFLLLLLQQLSDKTDSVPAELAEARKYAPLLLLDLQFYEQNLEGDLAERKAMGEAIQSAKQNFYRYLIKMQRSKKHSIRNAFCVLFCSHGLLKRKMALNLKWNLIYAECEEEANVKETIAVQRHRMRGLTLNFLSQTIANKLFALPERIKAIRGGRTRLLKMLYDPDISFEQNEEKIANLWEAMHLDLSTIDYGDSELLISHYEEALLTDDDMIRIEGKMKAEICVFFNWINSQIFSKNSFLSAIRNNGRKYCDLSLQIIDDFYDQIFDERSAEVEQNEHILVDLIFEIKTQLEKILAGHSMKSSELELLKEWQKWHLNRLMDRKAGKSFVKAKHWNEYGPWMRQLHGIMFVQLLKMDKNFAQKLKNEFETSLMKKNYLIELLDIEKFVAVHIRTEEAAHSAERRHSKMPAFPALQQFGEENCENCNNWGVVAAHSLLKLLDIGILANEIWHSVEAIKALNESKCDERWANIEMELAHLTEKEFVVENAQNSNSEIEFCQQIRHQLHLRKFSMALFHSGRFWSNLSEIRRKQIVSTLFRVEDEKTIELFVGKVEKYLILIKKLNEQRNLDESLFNEYKNGLNKFVSKKAKKKLHSDKSTLPHEFAKNWQEINFVENSNRKSKQIIQIKNYLMANGYFSEAERHKNERIVSELTRIVEEWCPDAIVQFPMSLLGNEKLEPICILPEEIDRELIFGKLNFNFEMSEMGAKCEDKSLYCSLLMRSEFKSVQKIVKELTTLPTLKFNFMDVPIEMAFILVPKVKLANSGEPIGLRTYEKFAKYFAENIEHLLNADRYDEGIHMDEVKLQNIIRKQLEKSKSFNDKFELDKVLGELKQLTSTKEAALKQRQIVAEQKVMLLALSRNFISEKIVFEILSPDTKLEENSRGINKNERLRVALAYLELWAKNNFIHGRNMGYLDTPMLLIMMAKVFLMFPEASIPFLIEKYFLFYSKWKWPMPVQLAQIDDKRIGEFLSWGPGREWFTKRQFLAKNLRKTIGQALAMPIISPLFPEQNEAAQINLSTAKVIQNELKNAFIKIRSTDKGHGIIKPIAGNCKRFSEKYEHFVTFTCGGTKFNVEKFCHFVGKRLRHELLYFVENSLANWVRFCHVHPTRVPVEQSSDEQQQQIGGSNNNLHKNLWLVGLKLHKQKVQNKFVDELIDKLAEISAKIKKDFEGDLFYNVQLHSEYVEKSKLAKWISL